MKKSWLFKRKQDVSILYPEARIDVVINEDLCIKCVQNLCIEVNFVPNRGLNSKEFEFFSRTLVAT